MGKVREQRYIQYIYRGGSIAEMDISGRLDSRDGYIGEVREQRGIY